MHKKKILFTVRDLKTGGITTSLFNLLNLLDRDKYDISLLVQSNEGLFSDSIPEHVKVINYNISRGKVYSRIVNRLKLLLFIIKNKNKYNFVGCYFPYDKHSTIISQKITKNNAIWIHTDLVEYCKNSNITIDDFNHQYGFLNFKKVIFVSEKSRNDISRIYTKGTEKFVTLHNIIDYKRIIKLSKEIDIKRDYRKKILLFVGRFDETEKRLSILIKACSKLDRNSYILWLVGTGQDESLYKELVENNNVNAIFFGNKSNPYPYFKSADCVVLPSRYEGFPVVLDETMVLKKPILITDVSDAKKVVTNKYGKIIECNEKSIIEGINSLGSIQKNYKNDFNPEEINKITLKSIEEMIEGK